MFKTIFLFPPSPDIIHNSSETTFAYSDHESGTYIFWNVSNL
jgi:hypothetical protein